MTPVRWTLLMTLLVDINGAVMSTVISPWLHGAGYSLAVIGVVVSLRGVASLFARVPGGLLYRPATARAAAVGSCFFLGASTMVYIFTADPRWVVSMRVIQGITWGVASTLTLAMFYDTVPDGAVRGRLIATQGLFEVLGHSIGNFSGGWLLDGYGHGAAFALSGAAAILAAACPFALPRLTRTPTPPQAGAAHGAGPRVGWRQRLGVLSRPEVLLPGAGYLSHRFIFQFLNAYFPLWGLEAGLSYTFIGSFRGVQSLAGLISRPVAGEATRLFRSEVLMVGGLILSALSVMVIPSTVSVVLLLTIAAGGSLARSATVVAMRLQLYEGTEANPETRGVASGLFLACGDIGVIVGPLVGGVVAGAWGLPASLRLVPLVGAGLIVTLVLLLRHRRGVGADGNQGYD